MGKSKFILQGFTPRTHVEAARRLFAVASLERAILSVAFANEGGVELIADEIEAVGDKVTALVGIRNAITSRQGLTRLLELGVKLFVVDTGLRNLVYHPKLYFARGADEARVVIGSANLTAGGLNNNIEAGMAIDLDLANSADREIAKEIEDGFDQSLSAFPANIIAIQTTEAIQSLQDTNRLLDEAVIRQREAAAASQDASETRRAGATIPPIRLLVRPIRRTTRGIAGGGPPRTEEAAEVEEVEAEETEAGEAGVIEEETEEDRRSFNEVLIAEVPAAGVRWKQINFDIGTYGGFFGVPLGRSKNVVFRQVRSDGSLGPVEQRQAVAVKSRNFRFEIGAAQGLPYPSEGHPIVIFEKITDTQFNYMLVMPGESAHTRIQNWINRNYRTTRGKRRIVITIGQLQRAWPSSPFFA